MLQKKVLSDDDPTAAKPRESGDGGKQVENQDYRFFHDGEG